MKIGIFITVLPLLLFAKAAAIQRVKKRNGGGFIPLNLRRRLLTNGILKAATILINSKNIFVTAGV